MKTIQEQIEVMQHFADGGEVEKHYGVDGWEVVFNPAWNWSTQDYRVKQPVDPYAELKAAAKDPTKQINCNGCGWMDSGYKWLWSSPVEEYEIRDKPKPVKRVKLLAWLVMGQLLLIEDGRTCIGRRVPSEDKEIEVEE